MALNESPANNWLKKARTMDFGFGMARSGNNLDCQPHETARVLSTYFKAIQECGCANVHLIASLIALVPLLMTSGYKTLIEDISCSDLATGVYKQTF